MINRDERINNDNSLIGDAHALVAMCMLSVKISNDAGLHNRGDESAFV
jgi:hypothetical protein